MLHNKVIQPSDTSSPAPAFVLRQVAMLALFTLLTVVMLFPLSVNLAHMVPEPTDPLLNAWRMQWNARSFLSGPAGLINLFNTNIFYPYPLTLAYSEHFLMESALALPLLLVAPGHLLGLNVSVLLTFVLSAYAMTLLVTAWTGRRWAGLLAGVLFAFSQQRFGQLNHLELLVTQWLPLALLALHWTLTRPGRRYAVLLALFINLQFLSGFHFGLNLVLALALLAMVYTLAGRVLWRRGLFIAAGLIILVTLLLNGPVWAVYLHFSDVMGAVRTPGEVRVYSAALTDYFTAIPYNRLYGWTFGHWPAADRQFQPLMPLGLTGLALALLGLGLPGYRRVFRRPAPSPIILFLLLLTLLALLLSFGLNENALGPSLAPVLKLSPYRWLYEFVPGFQAIRVPGRFGILAVAGLAGLAGWGAAALFRVLRGRRAAAGLAVVLAALVLLETWSVPLVGPEFPAGEAEVPPVYLWLRETPAETVVLELPLGSASEFLYEYYSSYHWRRLANGGTGFTPPAYKDLRRWLAAFPDARSVDVIGQLGIDRVVLHPAAFKPEEWQRIMAELPLYLPALAEVQPVGNDLVLQLARPGCPARSEAVSVALALGAEMGGLPATATITYHNAGPAAFVADVERTSVLTLTGGAVRRFTEPLVVPAGETQSVVVPLPRAASLEGVWLAGLDRSVPAGGDNASPPTEDAPAWQPLGLSFAGGPQLLAYHLAPEFPSACGLLVMALNWQGGQPGDTALVQLLDPFGRMVVESAAQPWPDGDGPDRRSLPLPGSLPAGRYGLRIRVRGADGQERLPVTEAGVTIPPDQVPPLPVTIHPQPPADLPAGPALASFEGEIRLLGSSLARSEVTAGDWLRFTLFWQAAGPVSRELTVFTQLLGPDGRVWGQQDHPPRGGWYGLPLWPSGQPVADDYAFPIDPATPPGPYRLIAGLYDSQTGQRLPLQSPAGGDFVEAGLVRVPGP